MDGHTMNGVISQALMTQINIGEDIGVGEVINIRYDGTGYMKDVATNVGIQPFEHLNVSNPRTT